MTPKLEVYEAEYWRDGKRLRFRVRSPGPGEARSIALRYVMIAFSASYDRARRHTFVASVPTPPQALTR
jgi:hypothetical protein